MKERFGTDPDCAGRDEVGERDGAERRQRGPELHNSPYD